MSVESVPGYLAGASSDPLMTIMAVTLIVLVLVGGVLYFKLHAVPEHIAHGKNHTQIQLITILTILALFTHNNIFWVAALVLAVVKLPDFVSPLKSIAKSLAIIAGNHVKEESATARTTRSEEQGKEQQSTEPQETEVSMPTDKLVTEKDSK